jgi:hypothetical protein
MLIKLGSCCLVAAYTIWTVQCWCFLYVGRLRLPEDDAVALKHVGVLTIYKILLRNICYTFVGLDNK